MKTSPLVEFLRPPAHVDEDLQRRSKVLYYLSLSIGLGASIGFFASLLVFEEKLITSISSVVLLGLALTINFLSKTNHVEAASHILLTSVWILTTGLVSVSGGMRSLDLLFYVSGTVVAGLLRGKRGSYIYGGAAVVVGVFFLFLESRSIMLPVLFPFPERSGWIILVINLAILIPALNATLDTLTQAVEQAHKTLEAQKRAQEELHFSEEKFSKAINASPMAVVFQRESDRRYIDVNAGFTRLTGYTREEALGRTVSELNLYPNDQASKEFADQIKRAGYSRDVIFPFRRKSGEIGYGLGWGEPLELDGEKVYMGGVIDITALRESQQALRESESRFRTFIEQVSDGIMFYNNQGRVVEWNKACEQITGLAKDRVLDKYIWDIQQQITPEDEKQNWNEEKLKQNIRKIFETGHLPVVDQSTKEENIQQANGSLVIVEQRLFPIQTEHGFTLGVALRDITERKHMEDALRASESLYRQAIEAAGGVPYLQSYEQTEGDGVRVRFDFIGEGIHKLTGYSAQEFNENVWDAMLQESILIEELAEYSWHEAIHQARSGKVPVWKCENRIIARDGRTRWVLEAAVELRDEQGFSHGSIGLYQDITARKQSEEKLKQRLSELALVNAVSQVAAAQLEVNEIIRATGEKLQRFPNVDCLFIALYDAHTQMISFPFYRFFEEVIQAAPLSLGQGLTSWVIQNRKPLIINQNTDEISTEKGVVRHHAPGKKHQPAKSWLGLPMQVGDQIVGVLGVQNFEREQAFSEEDVRLWETIAANVGVAIQNAQLYTAAQQEIAERKKMELALAAQAQEITTLYEALSRITGAPENTKTLSKRIAEIIVHDFHAYECGVWLLSEDKGQLDRGAYCGAANVEEDDFISMSMSGLVTAVAKTGEPIYAADVRTEPRYRVSETETRSEFVVPLLAHGEVLGVINMESPQLDDFSEGTRRLIVAFAENAALALQNAKLVTSLENINQELEQRVEERTAELQAVNKELETFSFSVSHDLRAPLRAIRGFSEIVVKDFGDQLDPVAKNFLDKVINGATELSDKIDGLLRFSRLSRSELRSGTLDLSALAIETLATLRAGDPGRAVTWEVRPQIEARGDLVLIRNVLENLLGNAWKYSSKNPQAHIEFGMEERDGKPVYFVRDNGAGFDMQYASKLFGTFQRLHRVDEFEGHGIGLATVQRIIHRHGGRIWAEAEEGRGATFYFTLGNPA